MASIPVQFRKGGETAIASYNYVDVAEGTGIVTYYGYSNASGAYSLTTNSSVFSDTVTTSGAQFASGGYVQVLDIDFDVEFNIPKNVQGKAMINAPMAVWGIVDAKVYGGRTDVILSKWDGTTETALGTASGAVMEWSTTAPNQKTYKVNAIELELPLTHFKKGETFRVTLKTYAKGADNSAGWIFLGHDPKSRAATAFTDAYTTMTANIPFRLDL